MTNQSPKKVMDYRITSEECSSSSFPSLQKGKRNHFEARKVHKQTVLLKFKICPKQPDSPQNNSLLILPADAPCKMVFLCSYPQKC